MSDPAPPPRRTGLGLPLRIYLVALLPVVATSLIVGALDLFTAGLPEQPSIGFLLLPVGLLLLLLAGAAVLFARGLVVPISRLAQTAAAFGAGQLDARTGIQRRDELGALAAAFDTMADQIAHLMQAQQALLANLSHELRTPLARIRVALDIVELDAGDARRAQLAGIADDLLELERLINSIMMTARLDLAAGRAGQLTLPAHFERIDAQLVLDDAVARYRRKVSSHPLETRLESPLPAIAADRVLLRRVVDNLLDNARKYSDPGRSVTLSARGGERGLEVEVADQGIGIAPADLQKIFTPFFRVDQSRARATGGVGLGLSLCRQIVEAHGGQIAIESEKGRGTRVRFCIPEKK